MVLAQSETMGQMKNYWLQVELLTKNSTATINTTKTKNVPDTNSFRNTQVKGRPEYLTCGRIADYEYVHYCYKYNMDVKLALIHRYNFVLNIFVLFSSCQTYVSTVDMSTV